ncbi:MAG: hypothetical protein ACXWJ0_08155 [Xanthobacteraceae bacterium]
MSDYWLSAAIVFLFFSPIFIGLAGKFVTSTMSHSQWVGHAACLFTMLFAGPWLYIYAVNYNGTAVGVEGMLLLLFIPFFLISASGYLMALKWPLTSEQAN